MPAPVTSGPKFEAAAKALAEASAEYDAAWKAHDAADKAKGAAEAQATVAYEIASDAGRRYREAQKAFAAVVEGRDT